MTDVKKLLAPGMLERPVMPFGRDMERVLAEKNNPGRIFLGQNENQFGASPKAMEAAKREIAKINFYPDSLYPDLRMKLAEVYGLKYDNFALTPGLTMQMDNLSKLFLRSGDEVITFEPTFFYAAKAARYGGKAVSYELPEEDYVLPLDKLRRAVREKTRIIWICNPNNPTGVPVPGDELAAFIRSLPEHVVAIVDEAYMDFVDDPKVYSMIPLVNEANLIVMRTMSKFYGLAGLRIGYLTARKELADAINANMIPFLVTRVSEAAAIAAFDDREFAEYSFRSTQESRNWLTAAFRDIGWRVYPSQTNFLYVDSHMPAAELADRLIKYNIEVNRGYKYSRISLGTMEQNRRLIDACRKIIAEK